MAMASRSSLPLPLQLLRYVCSHHHRPRRPSSRLQLNAAASSYREEEEAAAGSDDGDGGVIVAAAATSAPPIEADDAATGQQQRLGNRRGALPYPQEGEPSQPYERVTDHSMSDASLLGEPAEGRGGDGGGHH